jgi:hypothetical protein
MADPLRSVVAMRQTHRATVQKSEFLFFAGKFTPNKGFAAHADCARARRETSIVVS